MNLSIIQSAPILILGLAMTAVPTLVLPTAARAAQAAPSAVACTETALVAAVNAANAANGGVITLTPGCTYNLTASHGNDGVHGPDGLPPITTAITFEGNANVISRAASAAFRVVQVSSSGNLTLKAVTVSNGSAAGSAPAGNGGGILNLGALTLTNSAVTDSRAAGTGGGVQSGGSGSSVTFTGSTLSGNSAVGDGGGLYNFGTATFTSSFVDDNQGARGGGIASINGIFSLTSTPVSTNTATVTAGGFFRTAGTVTVNTSAISNNVANNCTGSVPAVPSCTS